MSGFTRYCCGPSLTFQFMRIFLKINMRQGHWFCDNCDDVVFMAYEKTSVANLPCPACGHLATNFVPSRITREMLGKKWFDAMRGQIDAATTPELYDQRHADLLTKGKI